ncbi:MAG: helix-turn-helix transcriptional regulator [Ruminococcaceae bacterium]|nr:helix-turn-helix transcriptional regulator [Oscillospiraceae bacterium]
MSYLKEYDLFEASRALGRLNLNLYGTASQTESYWCRVVLAEKERFNPKEHIHSFFELHLCLEGSAVIEVCGREVELNKNSYLLVSPFTGHKIISQSEGFRKFIWGFKVHDEKVGNVLRDKCSFGSVGNVSDDITDAVGIMLSNAAQQRFGYYDIIIGQLSYIYAMIVRDLCEIEEIRRYKKPASHIVDDIRGYISDNLKNCPSSADIAAQFSRSPSHIDKLCRSECGVTAVGLKKQIQLDKIKQLLADTDNSLDIISEMCGFADRFTMGKFFKKHEGISPGEFRRSSRK